jgi:hypothetical protein
MLCRGVQRSHGFPEDHGNTITTDATQLILVQLEQILAVDTTRMLSNRVERRRGMGRGHRLPRATFTH